MKTHQTILKACTIMSVALLSLVSTQKAMSQSLWGMTSGGGTYGNGEIFTVPSGDTGVTLEYSMTGIAGADPQYTALIKATDGLYYGMTAEGGINNDGVIFSYDSATKAYTELFEFNGQNGANPYGSLLQDTNGIMYGMTENGGLYGYGVVFSFNPATKAYTLLQSVASQSYPTGSFIQAASGKLYAVMPWGGMGNYYGFIFLWVIKTNGMGIISD
ncbi:MAG: choice-of-anchor tandem repeat GloVer-containing protein, partial [Bacteroidia bacterium]